MLEKPISTTTGRWTRSGQRLSKPLLRATAPLRRAALETFRGFRADRGDDLAASLAFATLIAAVPLLATFSLLLAAFFKQNVNEILEVVNAILPYHTARITENLREFIDESSAISGIGLVLLLVTSLRLIFIVEGVFNAVWGAPRRQGLVARTAVYSLVLLALGLLLGALGLGLRRLRGSTMGGGLLAGSIFPLVIEFVALMLLYRFLPNARVRWPPALAGAGVVAFALEVLRYFFELYVRGLSRMNLITGSLTFILLTLLSVYFVWTLILFGVELTSVLQNRGDAARAAVGPPAGPAENAIRMLVRLAGGAHLAQDVFDLEDPSAPEMERILGRLAESGLVSGSKKEGFLLTRSAQLITVARVIDALAPDLYTMAAGDDRITRALRPLFLRQKGNRRQLLATTIQDLAQR